MHDPPQAVLDAFLGSVKELALHAFGCRVLQKAFEFIDVSRQRKLLDELHPSVPILIEDAFGSESKM